MKTPTPGSEKLDRTVQWCPHCSGGREASEACSHLLAQVVRTPAPGDIFAGHYEFISTLGVGGMGVVYKCKNLNLDKIVAVKTLVARQFDSANLVRFQQEAKAAGKFNHPNLVSILDFGIADDGVPFMSMEYLEGETLSDAIAARRLGLVDLLRIFQECCDALAYAHRHKVLHRDLKPANIMLVSRDNETIAKILDFGIAKIADVGQLAQSLARTGAIFGTPPYMSPEQCAGEAVSEKSDVYALGCVMYEAFSGQRPFVGATAIDTFMLHQKAAPKPISEVTYFRNYPLELDDLILRMLAKMPDSRPSMDSMRWEIEQVYNKVHSNMMERLDAEELEKQSAEQVLLAESSERRKRFVFFRMAAATLILVAVSALAIWNRMMSEQPTAPVRAAAHGVALLGSSDENKLVPLEQEAILNRVALKRTQDRLQKAHIDLGEGLFTMPQAELLGREAKNCRALSFFRNNFMTADKIEKLRGMNVEQLHLRHCDIDDAALAECVNVFGDRLSVLIISDCPNLTEKGLESILRCKKLNKIHLADEPQNTGAFSRRLLLAMPKLIAVCFSRAKNLTDDDMEPLSRMNLNELILTDTDITDRTLKYIQRNRNLAVLALDRTKISEAELGKTVNRLPNLNTLNVGHTGVSEGIVRTLLARETLPGFTHMRSLCFDGLNITSNSVPYFPRFKELYALSLVDCPGLTGPDLNGLRKLMPQTQIAPGAVSSELDLIPTKSF